MSGFRSADSDRVPKGITREKHVVQWGIQWRFSSSVRHSSVCYHTSPEAAGKDDEATAAAV